MIFTLSHSNQLYSITTAADIYSVVEPSFYFIFKNTISHEQVENFIWRLFPDIRDSVSIESCGLSRTSDGCCATFTKNNFRSVVDRLYQNNILTTKERSNIEKHIVEFEKTIQNKFLVTSDLNGIQEDTIKYMVSPYIGDFLAIEDQYVSLSLMARSMLTYISHSGEDSDDLISTFDQTLLQRIKIALPDIEQRKAIYTSIGAIAKLSSGNRDMASTFVRLGKNIPDEKIQRNVIIKELYNAFNLKFNSDGHSALKLISYLALSGYSKYLNNINEWNNPERALATFIDSINDRRNYNSDIIFKYRKNELVIDIKNAMVATNINTDELNFVTLTLTSPKRYCCKNI